MDLLTHLTTALPDDDEVGKQIGPYKLLKKIGEGGGGNVYLAEQSRPVRRQVALKIIKAGMDTKSVITPFRSRAAGAGHDGTSSHRACSQCRRDGYRAAVFRHGTGARGKNYHVLRYARLEYPSAAFPSLSRSAAQFSTRT